MNTSDASRTTIIMTEPKSLDKKWLEKIEERTISMYHKMRKETFTHDNSVNILFNNLMTHCIEYNFTTNEAMELKTFVLGCCNELRKDY